MTSRGDWKRLKEAGVEFVEDPTDYGTVWIATLTDPEGNLAQLLQIVRSLEDSRHQRHPGAVARPWLRCRTLPPGGPEPTQRSRKGVDHTAPAEVCDDAGKARSDRPGGGPDQQRASAQDHRVLPPPCRSRRPQGSRFAAIIRCPAHALTSTVSGVAWCGCRIPPDAQPYVRSSLPAALRCRCVPSVRHRRQKREPLPSEPSRQIRWESNLYVMETRRPAPLRRSQSQGAARVDASCSRDPSRAVRAAACRPRPRIRTPHEPRFACLGRKAPPSSRHTFPS